MMLCALMPCAPVLCALVPSCPGALCLVPCALCPVPCALLPWCPVPWCSHALVPCALMPCALVPWCLVPSPRIKVGDTTVSVKVKRRNLPLTILTACTLYVLQGATTDPGMIFHWVFPRRLSKTMRWLCVYVALSRVRSLQNLRSVNLTQEIR